ncbi:putative nuclease HARBI1 [Diachasma alloeum]|uniref:putative nuclease HARBI1 n=1 Tax=Diachasma alloeum TaxID=454923 RepID=UPI0010FB5408|nr:putative nuclease HARBI1 [Diachasma alloeum]
MAISQPSVSRCIHEVIDILNQPDVFNEWVHFPRNLGELEEVRWDFYENFRFPGVIGCIDAHTWQRAHAPPKHDVEYLYVNRKGYHSLNVQLICDANYRILNANARYPGRSHDSFIWNNCEVLPLMRRLHATERDDFFLLGDSGNGLRPWLMTPMLDAAPDSPEERYTRQVTHTRSLFERVNSVLKMRFRCLQKGRALHYDPVVAAKITNACIVLHNICIANHILPPPMIQESEDIDFGIHRQFLKTGMHLL